MQTRQHRRPGAVLAVGAGALVGLIVAVVVVLNLHIWVGLEHGYATSPAEVWGRSVALGSVDVLLLVAGPVLGAVVARRRTRARDQKKVDLPVR